MVIRDYHCLNSFLISTCSAPLFDLDLQSQAAKVKVDPHAKKIKVKGQMAQTGERPHTDATKHIIAPTTLSITSQQCFLSPIFSTLLHHCKQIDVLTTDLRLDQLRCNEPFRNNVPQRAGHLLPRNRQRLRFFQRETRPRRGGISR